jgi:acetyl-CoA C-acetyltransferase
MQQVVVIASACRTAIGKFQGTLKETPVKELGALVGRKAAARAGITPGEIDEVICGNVIQAGLGGNIARQIQGAIGIPWNVPACTVNQLCASSMRALEIGFHSIMLGRAEVCLIVGVENMTMAPYLVLKGRSGYRMGPGTIEDAMLHDALTCAVENYHMGMTAENVASRYAISREEQDRLAVLSHERAVKAIKKGTFKDEIVPVEVKNKKQTIIFDTDEHPREGTTEEGLSSLKPVFKKDGTVTAGNASGINDGAAAVVLMSSRKARESGVPPLARVVTSVSAGVEPSLMGLGPSVAIPKALKQAELSFNEIDYWEVNEAFAAQFLGVQRRLKEEHAFSLDMEKVNRNGSGISLGHPVGCSGLRIIVTLIHEMKKMGVRHGCASLCAGGGPAMATIIAHGE